MPLVRVSHNHHAGFLRTVEELEAVLKQPDSQGGGQFWFDSIEHKFPCLAVRTCHGQADVHFFPSEGHPGFRLLAGNPKPEQVAFRYDGCDPQEGELVPGEFVVALSEALDIAAHFMEGEAMHEPSQWLEL